VHLRAGDHAHISRIDHLAVLSSSGLSPYLEKTPQGAQRPEEINEYTRYLWRADLPGAGVLLGQWFMTQENHVYSGYAEGFNLFWFRASPRG